MTFSVLMYALMGCACAGLALACAVETVSVPVVTLRRTRLAGTAPRRAREQRRAGCASAGTRRPVARGRRECPRRGRARRF